MTEKRYVFTYTRFQCGCAYRTIADTPSFCPQHRAPITNNETMYSTYPGTPHIPGLIMHDHFTNLPVVLRNTSDNSLHTSITTRDGDGNEWEETREDEVGLCAACLIDNDTHIPTRISMCECGNERCSYRWCGATTGLHAYWRLHARGQSEATTDIPEMDIFSHGSFNDQSDVIRSTLDEERHQLITQVQEIMLKIQTDRAQANATPNAEQQQHIHFAPWLDRNYQDMQKDHNLLNNLARTAFTKKVTRLHVVGAFEPA